MKTIILMISLLLFANAIVGQDLNKEANDQFKIFTDSRFFNYKGDTYINIHNEFLSGYISNEVYQFKKLILTFKNIPINEIERLNGMEWKGEIVITATANRHISWSNEGFPQIDKDKAIWVEWSTFPETKIIFMKKRGTWRFNDINNSIFSTKGIILDSNEIDQLLLRPMSDSN